MLAINNVSHAYGGYSFIGQMLERVASRIEGSLAARLCVCFFSAFALLQLPVVGILASLGALGVLCLVLLVPGLRSNELARLRSILPRPFPVLHDISFEIKPGELVCLLGPSGCGKSTLFHIIMGSLVPSRGFVSVNGDEVIKPGQDRGIVFQDYSLFPHLRVIDNVTMGLMLHETSIPYRFLMRLRDALTFVLFPLRRYFPPLRTKWEERAKEILSRVGLEGHMHKFIHELSGGQQQRVALARAIIMNTKVLLLDEPLGALDGKMRAQAQAFLRETAKQFTTAMLMVTHDITEALCVADRVICISQFWSDATYKPGRNHPGSRIVLSQPVVSHDPAAPAFNEQERAIHDAIHRAKHLAFTELHQFIIPREAAHAAK